MERGGGCRKENNKQGDAGQGKGNMPLRDRPVYRTVASLLWLSDPFLGGRALFLFASSYSNKSLSLPANTLLRCNHDDEADNAARHFLYLATVITHFLFYSGVTWFTHIKLKLPYYSNFCTRQDTNLGRIHYFLGGMTYDKNISRGNSYTSHGTNANFNSITGSFPSWARYPHSKVN